MPHVAIPVDLERSEKLDCPRPRAPRGAAAEDNLLAAEDHLLSVIEVFDQGGCGARFGPMARRGSLPLTGNFLRLFSKTV